MATNNHNPNCACLMSMAERELGAFLSAVTESYGSEEARISAEDWLDELESMDGPPEFASCELRVITITAAERLAARVLGREHYVL